MKESILVVFIVHRVYYFMKISTVLDPAPLVSLRLPEVMQACRLGLYRPIMVYYFKPVLCNAHYPGLVNSAHLV